MASSRHHFWSPPSRTTVTRSQGVVRPRTHRRTSDRGPYVRFEKGHTFHWLPLDLLHLKQHEDFEQARLLDVLFATFGSKPFLLQVDPAVYGGEDQPVRMRITEKEKDAAFVPGSVSFGEILVLRSGRKRQNNGGPQALKVLVPLVTCECTILVTSEGQIRDRLHAFSKAVHVPARIQKRKFTIFGGSISA